MGNGTDRVGLGSSGEIVFRVNWDQYDHQRSGGLLSGLLSENDTGIDCDASAFVIKRTAEGACFTDSATYDHPATTDDGIVHQGDNIENGGEEEQICIRLGCISEDEEIVFTLDTLKDKSQLKIGKISRITVSIDSDKGSRELYRKAFRGTGEWAVRLGRICREGDEHFFIPEMSGLSGVKEKQDIVKHVLDAYGQG